MFLDSRPWVYLWRPFYVGFYVPYLNRLKSFFFGDVEARLRALEYTHRGLSTTVSEELNKMELRQRLALANLEEQNRKLITLVEQQNRFLKGRVAQLETEQRNQWIATRSAPARQLTSSAPAQVSSPAEMAIPSPPLQGSVKHAASSNSAKITENLDDSKPAFLSGRIA